MGRSNPWGDLDQMWLVGRYGGHNHVCNIWWLSVKGCGCGERGKFAFSHWLHASPLQHWCVTLPCDRVMLAVRGEWCGLHSVLDDRKSPEWSCLYGPLTRAASMKNQLVALKRLLRTRTFTFQQSVMMSVYTWYKRKKLRFRHELTANDTPKTAKITKRWLPTSTSPKCQCAVE